MGREFTSEGKEVESGGSLLYPSRPSEGVDDVIEEIGRLIRGEEKPLKLDETEKTELLRFEDGLGETIERSFALNPISATVYIDYFLTPKGRSELSGLLPEIDIPNDSVELKRFIMTRSDLFFALDGKTRAKLFGDAMKYADEQVKKRILQENWTVDITGVENPDIVTINFNPEVLLEKIRGLRQMKKEMKTVLRTESTDDAGKARKEVAKMYLTRINELLAEAYQNLYPVWGKLKTVGSDNLTDAETELLAFAGGGRNPESSLSRLDKFVYGAGKENVDGWRQQIGPFMEERAEVLTGIRKVFETRKREMVLAKGFDPEKVFEADIGSGKRADWAELVLGRYGLLSAEKRTDYDPDRSGPAADGKWQYVPAPDRTSKIVNAKKKVVLDPANKNENVFNALAVGVGHEVEGHVLQHFNKSQLPLRLFAKVGGDRRAVMAEGGAMYIQNVLSDEMFGFKTVPMPQYVIVMKERLKGGDYMDCVKACCDNAIEEIRGNYDLDDEAQKKKFLAECSKAVDGALSRVRRIFANKDLQSSGAFLTSSRATVYMEQEIIMEKLAEKGLLKLAFVGQMNLNNAATLLRLGLLDVDKIMEPRLYTKEIWDSIKEDYR